MRHPPADAEAPSSGPGGRSFGALRYRDFRLFWGGALISHVGAWMHQIAQSWLIYDLTESPFLVGLSGVFLSVPFIAMSLYAGTVVDRVDRKRALVWIESLNLVIILGISVLVATGWVQVWHLYASNVLHALVGAFESPTRSALLPHLVPRDELMTAVSLNSVLRRGSQIVGPALGGVAIASVGVAGTYFAYAAAHLALLWSVAMIRTTNPLEQRSHGHPLQALLQGLEYVRAESLIGTLLLMEALMSLFGGYSSMMVVFAREIFGVGPQGLGLLQSASGAGTVVGALALAARGNVQRKGRLVVVSGVIYGLSVVAFAFCPSFLFALPILAASGAADIVMGATRTTIVQLLARREMLGRTMSLHAISTRGIGPFGGSQVGALTEIVGVQRASAFGATVCVGVTLAVALLVPSLWGFTDADRRPTPRGRPAASVPGERAVSMADHP